MNAVLDNGIKLEAPESMKLEHEELHQELYAATQEPGEVGEAARRVADLLHAHFEKEEEFALPPLGLLRAVAGGASIGDPQEVLGLTERLKADLPEMLAEHAAIVEALDALQLVAHRAGQRRYVRFAEALKLHAQTEEELAYPAAIILGEYLKLKLGVK